MGWQNSRFPVRISLSRARVLATFLHARVLIEAQDKRGAVFQRLIPAGERSGLLTLTATTESVSLCTRMKS
jgi:hypothetical protein